jgi:hypothetical protein
MKLFTMILAGVLVATSATVVACSDDEGDDGAGGTSGSGGSAAGSGGSGGSSAGSGGSGGSSGSGGSGGSKAEGGACKGDDPAVVSECKSTGAAEGTCSTLVDCACTKCACELQVCEDIPTCTAIRDCALRTGCCSTSQMALGCTGTACTEACITEIAGATEAGRGLPEVLAVDACVYPASSPCTPCPREGGTTGDGGGARDAASGG